MGGGQEEKHSEGKIDAPWLSFSCQSKLHRGPISGRCVSPVADQHTHNNQLLTLLPVPLKHNTAELHSTATEPGAVYKPATVPQTTHKNKTEMNIYRDNQFRDTLEIPESEPAVTHSFGEVHVPCVSVCEAPLNEGSRLVQDHSVTKLRLRKVRFNYIFSTSHRSFIEYS